MSLAIKEIVYKKNYLVKEQDTIKHKADSRLPPILATYVLVEWMENFAGASAQNHVAKGELTLGNKISIEHKFPSLPGHEVSIIVKTKALLEREIHFDIEALVGDVVIATASHTRKILNYDRLMRGVERLVRLKKVAKES